jgi:hypothetical protein
MASFIFDPMISIGFDPRFLAALTLAIGVLLDCAEHPVPPHFTEANMVRKIENFSAA